jgi:hypothetical protein
MGFLGAAFVVCQGVGVAQNSPFGRGLPGDGELERRAAQGATDMLEKAILRRGDCWYVTFELKSPAPVKPRQFGFAEPLTPNVEPRVEQGVMEIHFLYPPRGTMLPNGPVDVNARIDRYRVWRPGTGWGRATMVLINFLEWKGNVVGGALNLESLNDAKKGTSDGGVTGFVSEVFGVTAAQVRCSRTDAGHPALQLVPAGGIPAPRVAPGFFRNQPGMLPGDVAPPLAPAPAPAPAVKPRDPYRLGWGLRLLPFGANRPPDGNWSESGPGWRAGIDSEPIVAKPDSATMPADVFEAKPWFWSDAGGIQRTLVCMIKYHGVVELQDVSVTLEVTVDNSPDVFDLRRPTRTFSFKLVFCKVRPTATEPRHDHRAVRIG